MHLTQKNLDKLSDKELIEQLLLNDKAVIQYFFYCKCKSIFSYIVKEVFSYKVERDELISELYIYLQSNNWNKLRSFDYRSRLTTWLSVVSVRFFIKKRKYLIESGKKIAQIEELERDSIKEKYDNFIEKMDLYKAINKLKSPRDRFVIMSLEIEGQDEKDIARTLNVEVSNLYNIKKRAKKRLSNILKEYNNVR